jgi:hypothetical protein
MVVSDLLDRAVAEEYASWFRALVADVVMGRPAPSPIGGCG